MRRAQSAKHWISPEKETEIEIQEAAHLEALLFLLTSQAVEKNEDEENDESYFLINVDKGRRLGFYDSSDVRYAEVVSSKQGFVLIL